MAQLSDRADNSALEVNPLAGVQLQLGRIIEAEPEEFREFRAKAAFEPIHRILDNRMQRDSLDGEN